MMVKENYLRRYFALFQVALLVWSNIIRVRCNGPIINTDKGQVQGLTKYLDGKKYDVFFGIPYAKPPLGSLRYRLPVPPDRFEGVLNATTLPNSCIQAFDNFFPGFIGSNIWNTNTPKSEDCLYLNVWVPRTNPPYHDKAVIVWIYGGSFNSGTSTIDIYQADRLAVDQDVIVVSIQYRIGSIGFLALNTVEAPGNAGLYDQNMAVQWVTNNIHNFGGSNSKITLMGESAGAVSIGLLLLSPLTRDKFQRVILQSGSPQAKWGALPKSDMVTRSLALAEIVGCYKEDDHDYVVECFRSKNASDFPELDFRVTQGIIQFSFVPIIDGVLIPHDPQQLLDSGTFPRIPILLGSNENEATYFFSYERAEFYIDNKLAINVDKYRTIMQSFFFFYPRHPHRSNQIVKDAILHYYRNWLKPEDEWELLRSIDRAASDYYFVCAVNYLARSYARNDAPVYYYWFNHRWSANPWPAWMGVLHADEIWFVFGHPFNSSLSFTEEERQLSKDMMRYWGNFAKTGNPNEPGTMHWPLFKDGEQAYLNFTISSTPGSYYLGHAPRVQQCAFWDYYLPTLQAQTRNITDAETEWKLQFNEWKTKYIVDWKTQFDNFLQNYQRRMGSCSGGKP
ncbi:acetylcholinesterase [Biomphalaria glabrata]|uniref:Carboxylic ester hydrolase n=1 Tax=Biomphalaria glabrata TaxID=6526 RepID=A0A9W2YZN1_BIOGL|nr:acetylcholinesterase-like isoform X1 [Biomphalaria glabrata]XP_055868155.1 acetylcholinesterase-like isoform X1 [Biomphalaria glabrata]XP_055868156.1 acetylcholinesterase-like isoform X1 [Biomphalaria glabrata]XP_055868157.1 acetylcholinesterase-like isoform X1 [Biomphalaria glabrata]XP_055868158.1 acetylcholinesterase-like isoform X1 [Biomphalaria glabrata]XP_055868159.1 acetylcholinesterase-like isoform X1 [Biomphalaria glabrata]XP_055868160.1 acetylcholinesterase-like isoform X1 [Biomph